MPRRNLSWHENHRFQKRTLGSDARRSIESGNPFPALMPKGRLLQNLEFEKSTNIAPCHLQNFPFKPEVYPLYLKLL
ncbi:hypothetical protein CKA38_05170 [Ereboglobus luteus]|uniref:Uncharacterized protein n=1 Tax=Ereboglobus luteus TaxID=1796921 RepID=A0A2U8E1Q9_9BACT|nr:hypothetical protein CKA38_05170 [Ereboglobus luteus]